VATAAAAVAGFNDNEIDLAFARYRASTDGKRSPFRLLLPVAFADKVLQSDMSVCPSVCFSTN